MLDPAAEELDDGISTSFYVTQPFRHVANRMTKPLRAYAQFGSISFNDLHAESPGVEHGETAKECK